MNIICYGASVTAQKEQAGYFHALKQNFAARSDITLYQISFAASVFDQAGYSFMRSIEKTLPNPDICIIDWLTPGAVKFSKDKIEALSSYLLSLNCTPIWVSFPRADDINNERECYQQVKTHCEDYSLLFVDVYEDSDINQLPLEKILRDKVHTTPLGGKLYANTLVKVIESHISEQQSGIAKLQDHFDLKKVPFLLDKSFQIDSKNKIELQFSIDEDLNFELYFLAEIGPFTPIIEVNLTNSITNNSDVYVVNSLDVWSHYNRTKCVKIFEASMLKGEYSLSIKSLNIPAINDVDVKRPVDQEKYPDGSELQVIVSQLSCNALIENFKLKRV